MEQIEIPMEIHNKENSKACLLDARDAYFALNRSIPEENRVAVYIKHYCDYLNYPVLHGPKAVNDVEYEKLLNWINGYNYAKKIVPKIEKHRVIIEFDNYYIVLSKPFSY